MLRVKPRTFYLFIAPWLIGLIGFQLAPLLVAFVLSLSDWLPGREWRFVGSNNYAALLTDRLAWHALGNTLIYGVGTVLPGIVLSFALAWLVRRGGVVRSITRTTLLLPAFCAGIATTMVWAWLLNGRWGLVNQLLALIGIRGSAWLQDATWAMPALIVIGIWGMGGNVVVYLAGLRRIPRDLYEAAALDGATAWQQAWRIAFPQLAPVTLLLVVTGFINALLLFSPNYLLTRGGPDNATLTAALYMYQNAFLYQRFGYAAALAWVLVLLIMALAGGAIALLRGDS